MHAQVVLLHGTNEGQLDLEAQRAHNPPLHLAGRDDLGVRLVQLVDHFLDLLARLLSLVSLVEGLLEICRLLKHLVDVDADEVWADAVLLGYVSLKLVLNHHLVDYLAYLRDGQLCSTPLPSE